MRFENDMATCWVCGNEFIAPYKMLQHNKRLYCSSDCLVSDLDNVKEIELLTADDKELIEADM